MIDRIQSANAQFKARLSLHPDIKIDEKVYEEFSKRTKRYPLITMSQETASMTGDDAFYLRHYYKNLVLVTDTAAFTSNRPKNFTGTVNRFLQIFDQLIEKAKKNGISLI